jgi:hypothetical protein
VQNVIGARVDICLMSEPLVTYMYICFVYWWVPQHVVVLNQVNFVEDLENERYNEMHRSVFFVRVQKLRKFSLVISIEFACSRLLNCCHVCCLSNDCVESSVRI